MRYLVLELIDILMPKDVYRILILKNPKKTIFVIRIPI